MKIAGMAQNWLSLCPPHAKVHLQKHRKAKEASHQAWKCQWLKKRSVQIKKCRTHGARTTQLGTRRFSREIQLCIHSAVNRVGNWMIFLDRYNNFGRKEREDANKWQERNTNEAMRLKRESILVTRLFPQNSDVVIVFVFLVIRLTFLKRFIATQLAMVLECPQNFQDLLCPSTKTLKEHCVQNIVTMCFSFFSSLNLIDMIRQNEISSFAHVDEYTITVRLNRQFFKWQDSCIDPPIQAMHLYRHKVIGSVYATYFSICGASTHLIMMCCMIKPCNQASKHVHPTLVKPDLHNEDRESVVQSVWQQTTKQAMGSETAGVVRVMR